MPRRPSHPFAARSLLPKLALALLLAVAGGCAEREAPAGGGEEVFGKTPAPATGSACPDVAANDPVRYSFVVLGCNRVDRHDTKGRPSTANLEQLDRIYDEIATLPRLPDMIFFTGDLVLGLKDQDVETTDPDPLEFELDHWVRHYEASAIADKPIRLVAMMGNHESLQYESGVSGEVPNPAAEGTWVKVMSEHPDNSTLQGYEPCVSTDDPVCNANALNYSFRYRGDHFVVLNTDPYPKIATVPNAWLAKNVAAARQDPAVKHVFAFGHKPASTSSDFSLGEHAAMRDEFWRILNGSADKNGYYLTAHVHAYERRLFSTTDSAGKSHTGWEVVAGNAGSPLSWSGREITPDAFTPGFSPPAWEQHFGFTVVTVTQSERVYVQHHGWELGDSYLETDPAEQPTRCWDSADVTVSG